MKYRTALQITFALCLAAPPIWADDAEEAPADEAPAGEDQAEQAEPAPAAADKNSREYLIALVTDGAALYDSGKYPEAIDKLKEAYSIKSSPTIGVVLAHAYRDAGRIGEAIDVYALVGDTELTEDSHEKVVDSVNTAKEQHKMLSAKAVHLNLAIAGPDHYQVAFNGKETPPHRSGAYILLPGVYTIEVSADGYVPVSFEFVGQSGRKPFQTIELKKKTAAVAAAPAAAPAVQPREAAPVLADEPAADKPKRTKVFQVLGWTSLGISVASTVGGSVLILYGSTQDTQAEEQCSADTCGPEAQQYLDNRDTAAMGATIAFSVAGGLFATGITLLVLDGGHKRRHRRRYLDSQKNASNHPSDRGLAGIDELRVIGRPGGLSLAGSF